MTLTGTASLSHPAFATSQSVTAILPCLVAGYRGSAGLAALAARKPRRRAVGDRVPIFLEQELDRLVEGDPGLGDEGRISRRLRLVRALLDAISPSSGSGS